LNRLNYRRKIANGGSNFSQRQRPKIKKWAAAILVSGNGQKLKMAAALISAATAIRLAAAAVVAAAASKIAEK